MASCRRTGSKGTDMDEVYEEEPSRARVALTTGKFEVCFAHLERAHGLSQRMTLTVMTRRAPWIMKLRVNPEFHINIVGQQCPDTFPIARVEQAGVAAHLG